MLIYGDLKMEKNISNYNRENIKTDYNVPENYVDLNNIEKERLIILINSQKSKHIQPFNDMMSKLDLKFIYRSSNCCGYADIIKKAPTELIVTIQLIDKISFDTEINISHFNETCLKLKDNFDSVKELYIKNGIEHEFGFKIVENLVEDLYSKLNESQSNCDIKTKTSISISSSNNSMDCDYSIACENYVNKKKADILYTSNEEYDNINLLSSSFTLYKSNNNNDGNDEIKNKEVIFSKTISNKYSKYLKLFDKEYKDKVRLTKNSNEKELNSNDKEYLSILKHCFSHNIKEHKKKALDTFYIFYEKYFEHEYSIPFKNLKNTKTKQYELKSDFKPNINSLFDYFSQLLLSLDFDSSKNKQRIDRFQDLIRNKIFYSYDKIRDDIKKRYYRDNYVHPECYLIGELLENSFINDESANHSDINEDDDLRLDETTIFRDFDVSGSQLISVLRDIKRVIIKNDRNNRYNNGRKCKLVLTINSYYRFCSNCKTHLSWLNRIINYLISNDKVLNDNIEFFSNFFYEKEDHRECRLEVKENLRLYNSSLYKNKELNNVAFREKSTNKKNKKKYSKTITEITSNDSDSDSSVITKLDMLFDYKNVFEEIDNYEYKDYHLFLNTIISYFVRLLKESNEISKKKLEFNNEINPNFYNYVVSLVNNDNDKDNYNYDYYANSFKNNIDNEDYLSITHNTNFRYIKLNVDKLKQLHESNRNINNIKKSEIENKYETCIFWSN